MEQLQMNLTSIQQKKTADYEEQIKGLEGDMAAIKCHATQVKWQLVRIESLSHSQTKIKVARDESCQRSQEVGCSLHSGHRQSFKRYMVLEKLGDRTSNSNSAVRFHRQACIDLSLRDY